MKNFSFLYGSAYFFGWGKLHHNLERVFRKISNTLKCVETFSATRCVYMRDEIPCLMLSAIISNSFIDVRYINSQR